MKVPIERYLTINDSVLEWFYEVKKFPKLICSLDGKKLPMEVVHTSLFRNEMFMLDERTGKNATFCNCV